MSIARTARRRRSQYKKGQRGLAAIFGKHAPKYCTKIESAAKRARWLANKAKGFV